MDSVGNHAQGVAVAAKHLKIPAVIVMPLCTPAIKYQSVQRLGSFCCSLSVCVHGFIDDELFQVPKWFCLGMILIRPRNIV